MFINTMQTIEKCLYTSIVRLPPDEEHKSTFVVVSIIEKGEATVEFISKDGKKSKTVTMNENTCFITMPFSPIIFKSFSKNNYTQRNVHIDERTFKECCDSIDPNLYAQFLFTDYPIIFSLSGPTSNYLSESCSMMMGDSDPVKEKLHKCCVYSILSAYISNTIKNVNLPLWIRALLRRLEDIPFLIQKVKDIIVSTNYSHGYVNREFKRCMNISLKQYITNKKIEIASTLIVKTNLTLQAISDTLNFCTVSSLISAFKKAYGTTPAKYRKQNNMNINLDSYIEWGEKVEVK